MARTAAKITTNIKADIQGLGSRVEVVKTMLQTTIACTNQHMHRIQDLQDQLDTALSKIDDLENGSRRYNSSD